MKLTQENVTALRSYMEELNGKNWGAWPSPENWPSVGVGYSLNQYEANGKTATVVNFDNPVTLPDTRKGKRFSVGNRRASFCPSL